MRSMIVILAALACASCGGGGSSGSMADPAASASATAMPSTTTSVKSSSSTTTTPPTASAPSSGSSSPPPTTPSPPTSPAPPATPPGPRFYKIVEIPRLDATGSITATGVNDQGFVVGEQETATAGECGSTSRALARSIELTFATTESGAYVGGITDSGVIAGAEVPNGPPEPGFWTVTGGAMLLMGQYQSYAEAVAANNNGTHHRQLRSVRDGLWPAPGLDRARIRGDQSARTQCDNCNRFNANANAINDGGVIVGSSTFSFSATGATGMHAVEWQNASSRIWAA